VCLVLSDSKIFTVRLEFSLQLIDVSNFKSRHYVNFKAQQFHPQQKIPSLCSQILSQVNNAKYCQIQFIF